MRVAFLSSHPIQYHASWFKVLADQPGLDLQVLYCHHPSPQEQGDAGFGVPFTWDVPILEGYSYRFLRNVARRPSTATFCGLDTPEIRDSVRRGEYDAVITNGWHYKSAWQAITACWRYGVPVLVRSDSHLRTARGAIKVMLKTAPYRFFISRLDGCLAAGRWSAQYFLHFGAARDRVHIVPHVVDSAFAAESGRLAARRQELREEWSLRSDQVVFLFAGKFVQQKRPLDFVRAVQQAAARNQRVTGLMVGDGPLRRECEAAVRDSRMPIRFAGFLNQSQIASAYIAADAIVVPSAGETWGLVVNEAMSCGMPALVSDQVGCGPDLVRPGETGFVFPVGDVQALACFMVEGASCPGRLRLMGSHARERLNQQHSIEVAVDRLVAALTQTVAGR